MNKFAGFLILTAFSFNVFALSAGDQKAIDTLNTLQGSLLTIDIQNEQVEVSKDVLETLQTHKTSGFVMDLLGTLQKGQTLELSQDEKEFAIKEIRQTLQSIEATGN